MPLSHSLNVIFGAAAVSGAGVRRDRRRQLSEIIGDRRGVVAEQFADRTVDVEMDGRPVIRLPDFADAADDALGISDQLFAPEADVALDLLERGVRQQFDPLQDHPVDHLPVLLVAGGEDRQRRGGDVAGVFAGDDLGDRAMVGERGGVQQRLGNAVAERGVERLTPVLGAVDLLGERAEPVDRPAAQPVAYLGA